MGADGLPSWKELQPYVEVVLGGAPGAIPVEQVRNEVAVNASLTPDAVASKFPSGASRYEDRISDALRDLVKQGRARRVKQGWYETTAAATKPIPTERAEPAKFAAQAISDLLDGLDDIDDLDIFGDAPAPAPPNTEPMSTPQAPAVDTDWGESFETSTGGTWDPDYGVTVFEGAPGDPPETRWWYLDQRILKRFHEYADEYPHMRQKVLDELIGLHRAYTEELDAFTAVFAREFQAAGGDGAFTRAPNFPVAHVNVWSMATIGDHIDWIPSEAEHGENVFEGLARWDSDDSLRAFLKSVGEQSPEYLSVDPEEMARLQTTMADALAWQIFTIWEPHEYKSPRQRLYTAQGDPVLSGRAEAESSLKQRDASIDQVSRHYERVIVEALKEAHVPKDVADSGRLVVNLGLAISDPSQWPAGIRLTAGGPQHVLFGSRGQLIPFPSASGGARRVLSSALNGNRPALTPSEGGSWDPDFEMAIALDNFFGDGPNPFTSLVREAVDKLLKGNG